MLTLSVLAVCAASASFFLVRAFTGGDERQAQAELPDPAVLDIQAPGPDFSNKVLHWVTEDYSYVPEGPDTANGLTTSTEVWVRFGPLNIPSAVRSLTTVGKGTFHQAALLLEEQGLLIIPQGVGEGGECEIHLSGVASIANMADMRPFYVDFTKAKSVGLLPADVATATRPEVSSPTQSKTAEILGGGASASYSREFPVDEGTLLVTESLERETGLRQAEHVEIRSPDGKMLIERKTAYSEIQVFLAADVPDSTFTRSFLPEGICK